MIEQVFLANRVRIVSLIGVLALLAAIIVGITAYLETTRGATSERELVNKYLRALEKSDEEALRRLIPKTHVADAEITSRLRSFGGGSFRNTSVSFSGDVSPNHRVATVVGQLVDREGREQQYKETLNLQRAGKRWLLILGQYKGPLRIPGPGLTAPAQ